MPQQHPDNFFDQIKYLLDSGLGIWAFRRKVGEAWEAERDRQDDLIDQGVVNYK